MQAHLTFSYTLKLSCAAHELFPGVVAGKATLASILPLSDLRVEGGSHYCLDWALPCPFPQTTYITDPLTRLIPPSSGKVPTTKAQ